MEEASLALAHKIHDEQQSFALTKRVQYDKDSLALAWRLYNEEKSQKIYNQQQSLALIKQIQDDEKSLALARKLQTEEHSRIHEDQSQNQKTIPFHQFPNVNTKFTSYNENQNEEKSLTLARQLQNEEQTKILVSQLENKKTMFSNHNANVDTDVTSHSETTIFALKQSLLDIRQLMQLYDNELFGGQLGAVEVRWSKRMTICAGICSYEGKGGLCSIALSEKLLQFRSKKEIIETLLHEMIHAYLFIVGGNKNHNSHGPLFKSHMHRINKCTQLNITIYHSFHNEVNYLRQHWWKCSKSCNFPIVKRSMNKPPGRYDKWFVQHITICGGTWIKIKEPKDYELNQRKKK